MKILQEKGFLPTSSGPKETSVASTAKLERAHPTTYSTSAAYVQDDSTSKNKKRKYDANMYTTGEPTQPMYLQQHRMMVRE